jgi:hypothetical protein
MLLKQTVETSLGLTAGDVEILAFVKKYFYTLGVASNNTELRYILIRCRGTPQLLSAFLEILFHRMV